MKLPNWLSGLVKKAEDEVQSVLSIEATIAPWLAAAKLLPPVQQAALEAALQTVAGILKSFEPHVQAVTAPPPAAPPPPAPPTTNG